MSIKQRVDIGRPLRKLLYFSRGEMIGGMDKSGNGEMIGTVGIWIDMQEII